MVTLASPEAGIAASARARLSRLWRGLFDPVDIASLVFFRIFFGVIAFWHVWLQMRDVRARYIEPDFHFKYYGFEWVHPLPGELMYVVFLLMAAAAILIALGFLYRFATVTFFVTHTYVLLIEQAVWWNHYYLITLIAFLLIFIPAHRALSLDVALRKVPHSDDAPAWGLWLLRGQMGIVYFFAGLAKLSSVDWLHGKPMDVFLENSVDSFPLVGRWFTDDWAIYGASYAGMLFDLLIVPALLWPRTRLLGLTMAVVFHLSNSLIFNIQVFPWLALVATLLFLPPAWPRLGGQWRRLRDRAEAALPGGPPGLSPRQTALACVLGLYFLIQVALPLRHFAYDGNAEWTKAGQFFGWRMLLASRQNEFAFYAVSHQPEAICEVDHTAYLYPFQIVFLDHPDAMLQFAHYVADEYEERGAAGFEVQVWTNTTLNGRTPRALIDPDVDLLAEDRSLALPAWVTDVDDAVPVERPVAERCPDPAPLQRLQQLEDVLHPE